MEKQFNDMILSELDKQFEEDMLELLENDEFYNEIMEIENVLKMEGF